MAWFRVLGPGLLFAAIAVGASHLVQSTRAGAAYGLALVAVIVLANVVKYPAFRFGVTYAASTGESLLSAYRAQGRWAVIAYLVVALGTMFAAEAAVTLVTVGLLKAVFDLQFSDAVVAAAVLMVSALILIVGGYRTLDRLIKLIMVVLAVATVAATLMVLPRIDWGTLRWFPVGVEARDWMFLAALIGLMPTSLDISVMHSLWAREKALAARTAPTYGQSVMDFHVGYVGTVLLALCFVLLGAGVMHETGVRFETGAAAFASQLIDLYAQTLGAWSAPVLGTAAVAVMFSTVLAGLDGYPRAAVELERLLRPDAPADRIESRRRMVYRSAVVIQAAGAFLILLLFYRSLAWLVDLAAVLAFLFAPVVAWLNHRAVVAQPSAGKARPGPFLRAWSVCAIAVLLAMGMAYLYIRLGAAG